MRLSCDCHVVKYRACPQWRRLPDLRYFLRNRLFSLHTNASVFASDTIPITAQCYRVIADNARYQATTGSN